MDEEVNLLSCLGVFLLVIDRNVGGVQVLSSCRGQFVEQATASDGSIVTRACASASHSSSIAAPAVHPDLPRRIGELGKENPYLDIKYRFAEAEARRRFFGLTVSILNRLALLHGDSAPRPVAWHDFESATDEELAALNVLEVEDGEVSA